MSHQIKKSIAQKGIYDAKDRLQADKYIRRKYGITIEDYDQMLLAQNGLCGACRTLSTRKLAIDHDHETGEVRGLLCGNCNTALGMLKDDPIKIRGLLDYMSGHDLIDLMRRRTIDRDLFFPKRGRRRRKSSALKKANGMSRNCKNRIRRMINNEIEGFGPGIDSKS